MIDSFTRLMWITALPNKTAESVLLAFKKMNETIKENNEKINALCTDRGKEFVNSSFQKYLLEEASNTEYR